MTVHPSAIVDPGARLGEGVRIGPFCLVGPEVVLGDGVELRSHVVVAGDTEIGAGTTVFPHAVLGEIPQDLKYAGERTRLRIGPRNRIRENVTMNLGTAGGGGETRVGEGCLFMAGCHVAHDAQVGDRVIVANCAAIAGHCLIGDDVVIGGLAGIHQWVRIGRGAMIGALAMVTHDVIPHGLVQGPRGELDGLNLVGLKRRGVPREEITALRHAYQALRDGEGAFQDRARALASADSAMVREWADFVLSSSDRQFLTPR
ncbi:acyl-ACP--UDP-N-acetylglucosamine O-acyltransferase [Rubellimicrobium aerolatum]|uniref:Acyl-ACP--UDP-N-acetylglucosamine O-acyltransferase n=1 Tax=Rubellimicrobium aerolatum TaxID=490979 RepID=A0ABW0S8F2_9RHOB|nr:acyl-ACP--UDP-N-acetylglucosamine O-acyltransferase [Rubellimicrobium aerolatum]MBP1804256.1 UDP-N-acetylglucosamine acyltransferase [Rubellimicrobium aerolatum]